MSETNCVFSNFCVRKCQNRVVKIQYALQQCVENILVDDTMSQKRIHQMYKISKKIKYMSKAMLGLEVRACVLLKKAISTDALNIKRIAAQLDILSLSRTNQ